MVDKADVSRITDLLENQYQIIDISDAHYTLKKEFNNLKTLRISLTEKCNYRCFFCHEEGLDMEAGWESKSENEIYELIIRAISRGYTDVTFTGGEPLIKYKEIISILNRLNSEHFQPDISITTNAQLINNEIIESVKTYKRNEHYLSLSKNTINNHIYILSTQPLQFDIPDIKTLTTSIETYYIH
ncbi:MAG: radical SAM protein [bacterium]